jgi:LysM repeat protein
VRRGETLSSIARKYRVGQEEILQANHLKSAKSIRAGKVLRIPREVGVSTASSETSKTPVRAGQTRKTAAGKTDKGVQTTAARNASTPPGAENAASPVSTGSTSNSSAAPTGQTAVNSQGPAAAPGAEAGARAQTFRYRVKDGDTLFSIAKRFNTTVDEIKVLNALESNIVKVGQLIHVPNASL